MKCCYQVWSIVYDNAHWQTVVNIFFIRKTNNCFMRVKISLNQINDSCCNQWMKCIHFTNIGIAWNVVIVNVACTHHRTSMTRIPCTHMNIQNWNYITKQCSWIKIAEVISWNIALHNMNLIEKCTAKFILFIFYLMLIIISLFSWNCVMNHIAPYAAYSLTINWIRQQLTFLLSK